MTVGRATVRRLLQDAGQRLGAAGVPDAETEAELLLAHCLGTDRGGLLVRKGDTVAEEDAGRFRAAVETRADRVPFQYITGRQEFYGREFRVDPRVLVPRPETELLVDRALQVLPEGNAKAADLGTGSGCIAVTLLAERAGLEMVAVDRSAGALEAARDNARLHQVEDRVEFLQADLADLPEDLSTRFDLVVSNPPYVTAGDWAGLAPEVRDHEPRIALVPEEGPERMYAGLARTAWRLLKPGGTVLMEIGYDGAGLAEAAAVSAGFGDPLLYPDFQGIRRVLLAGKGSEP